MQLLDGRGTLPVVAARRPDLILLDVNLRLSADGFELCRQLKLRDDTRFAHVVLVSGISLERSEEEARATAAGAQSILRKPFTPEELQSAIDRCAASRLGSGEQGGVSDVPAKVIVVDDDAQWLALASLWLKGAGCSVVQCATRAEAMRLIEEEKPDCVIMDFDLGDSLADALCCEIRARREWKHIQVIGHSAYPQARNRMLELGADQFVEKTPDPARLLASVKAALRRRQWEKGVLANGDLRLDPTVREVVWNSTAARLSEEQFNFLYLLVVRADHWVPLSELDSGLGRKFSVAAANQLASRLRQSLPVGIRQRIRFHKQLGWTYQRSTSCQPTRKP